MYRAGYKNFRDHCFCVVAVVVSLNSVLGMKHVEYIELNALAYIYSCTIGQVHLLVLE